MPIQPESKHLKVVFIGDSLTQLWDLTRSFPGENYINKGVSGETSAQILTRFPTDALNLSPDLIMLMAGTNDVGGIPLTETESNIQAMINMANDRKIPIVIATIPPKAQQLGVQNGNVNALNHWISTSFGVPVVDYFGVLVDSSGQLRSDYSTQDLICCQHLNDAGYQAITPLAKQIIGLLASTPAQLFAMIDPD